MRCRRLIILVGAKHIFSGETNNKPEVGINNFVGQFVYFIVSVSLQILNFIQATTSFNFCADVLLFVTSHFENVVDAVKYNLNIRYLHSFLNKPGLSEYLCSQANYRMGE